MGNGLRVKRLEFTVHKLESRREDVRFAIRGSGSRESRNQGHRVSKTGSRV